jgi:DNA-directed RNA polymerase delta subunit
MKIVLITTTIHVPHVLRLYRKLNQDVHFIVVGDKKTPHEEVRSFVHELGNAAYYSESEQETLGYKCIRDDRLEQDHAP